MRWFTRSSAGLESKGTELERALQLARELDSDQAVAGDGYRRIGSEFERAARELSAQDRKTLAFSLMAMSRGVHHAAPVVEQALREDRWSLEDLERLLALARDNTAARRIWRFNPYRPYWGGDRTHDVRSWPWGLEALLRQLEHHRKDPEFGRVFHDFLLGTYRYAYPSEPRLVPKVLALAHPDGVGALLESLRVGEEERRALIERYDLTRVEQQLKCELSSQLWALRNGRLLPPGFDADAYTRLLRALAPDGESDLARLEAEASLEGAKPYQLWYPKDLFTGKQYYDGRWSEMGGYIAELCSLADEPRGRFLSHFAPQVLRERFFQVERAYAAASTLQWLMVWEALERDVEKTVTLLSAMCSLPESSPSSPPKVKWWAIWRKAVEAVDPALLRSVCERVWRVPEHPDVTYDPVAQVMTRAAIWGVCEVAAPETADQLGALAKKWMDRGDGTTLSFVSVRALDRLNSPGAVAHLQHLARRTKNKPLLRAIEQGLERAASAQGLDRESLDDLAADSLGLDRQGRRAWALGEYRGELELTSRGRVETHYVDTRSGERTSTPPRAVKGSFGSELAAMRDTAKQLRGSMSLQTARLEEAMTDERVWGLEGWQQTYGENPVLAHLARRLVWRVEEEGRTSYARPERDRLWLDSAGGHVVLSEGARLSVAHPVGWDAEQLHAWQSHVVRHEIVQPFKQVYRETYVLTPAEERTRTYSNRFAAQVVVHRKLYALLRGRGWAGLGYLGDVELTAQKDFPAHRIRALLEVSDFDIGAADGEDVATLDRVWFHRLDVRGGRLTLSSAALPLQEVPAVAFSEAMRDVDLFAGVAGIGTDVNWEEWEVRRARHTASWSEAREAYDRMQAATADQRAFVLRELLPALGLGEAARIEGRWVLVRGSLHEYRVHLGSGNIHIEPEGRYLCIVPARRKMEELYVPFEESDLKTAEIVSKVLLLASDHKIGDPTILRQL